MSVQVEVCERLMDGFTTGDGTRMPKYHACIAGEEGYWSCGRTVEQALAGVLRSHSERFPRGRAEMEVRYLGVLAR